MQKNSRAADQVDINSHYIDKTLGEVQYAKSKMVYNKFNALELLRFRWGGVTRPQ